MGNINDPELLRQIMVKDFNSFVERTVPGASSLLEKLNINIWKKKETKFFYDVVLSTIKMRREGKQQRRNDLVDLMIWKLTVQGLHRDPAHWSHPEEFYPEHFSKEEKATRSPYAFQAFGQGPRNCIGMRFALLEAKVALLAVCRRFTFLPGTKMKEPLRQDPNSQLGWPKGGIWVNVERR